MTLAGFFMESYTSSTSDEPMEYVFEEMVTVTVNGETLTLPKHVVLGIVRWAKENRLS